ncbi:putative protein [Streptomyces sp. enrichment culture]
MRAGGGAAGPSGGWRGGDYAAAGDAWAHAADDVTAVALARLAGPGLATTGARVLDVGTGTGPAALAAARAGADVVGLDREPALLRIAAARARRDGHGSAARFVAGDALDLPFPADAFDIVLSTFGVMFAPDAPRAAAELVRVCRPGGLLAVASWTPDGVLGRIAPTVLRHLDRPPAAAPPTRWGVPAHLDEWFAPLPLDLRSQVRTVRVTYPSLADAVSAFENKPGPLRTYRTALRDAGRWDRARADLTDLFRTHNLADDGRLVMDVPYLLLLGRRKAA